MKLTNRQANKIEELRAELEAQRAITNEALEAYRKLLAQADLLASEIAEDLRERWDARTERWQESDAGQEAASFVEEWEEFANRDAEEEDDGPIVEDIDQSAFEELPTMDEHEAE